MMAAYLFWALGDVSFPVAFSGRVSFRRLLLGVVATPSGVARRFIITP